MNWVMKRARSAEILSGDRSWGSLVSVCHKGLGLGLGLWLWLGLGLAAVSGGYGMGLDAANRRR